MKVSDLLTEICNRAGEGYQNYADRARSHFRSAALSLAEESKNIDVDAPGLYAIGETTVLNDTQKIPMSQILTAAGMEIGVLRSLRYGITALASVETELGGDNEIIYTARPHIPNGNIIGIEYVIPARQNSPLSVTVEAVPRMIGLEEVDGIKITVHAATDSLGEVITTAADIVYRWDSFPGTYYVSAVVSPGSGEGTDLIQAMAEVLLIGGTGANEFVPLERITRQQQETARLRPLILASRDRVNFYTITGDKAGSGAVITLINLPPFNAQSTVEYSVIGWLTVLNNGNTEVEPYFSPGFLNKVIDVAANSLRLEIQA